MKKIILGMACMLALGAASATAQNNTACPVNNCKQAQCVPANCNQTPCYGPQSCQAVCPNGPQDCVNSSCPFLDLNLTDAQKQKLQELNKDYAAKRQALGAQRKADKARKDSARNEYRKQCKDLREQKLADIKKILTPEQYTKFLESYYKTGDRQGRKFHKGVQHREFRHKGDFRNRETRQVNTKFVMPEKKKK